MWDTGQAGSVGGGLYQGGVVARQHPEGRVQPLESHSFELRATPRELRATLRSIDVRLAAHAVEGGTRRHARHVVGELVARWLAHAGAADPMVIVVSVLPDQVRLDFIDAAGHSRGAEFWLRMSVAPAAGKASTISAAQARSGLRLELPRTARPSV